VLYRRVIRAIGKMEWRGAPGTARLPASLKAATNRSKSEAPSMSAHSRKQRHVAAQDAHRIDDVAGPRIGATAEASLLHATHENRAVCQIHANFRQTQASRGVSVALAFHAPVSAALRSTVNKI
jgi:hypothetical protein